MTKFWPCDEIWRFDGISFVFADLRKFKVPLKKLGPAIRKSTKYKSANYKKIVSANRQSAMRKARKSSKQFNSANLRMRVLRKLIADCPPLVFSSILFDYLLLLTTRIHKKIFRPWWRDRRASPTWTWRCSSASTPFPPTDPTVFRAGSVGSRSVYSLQYNLF